MSMKDFFMSRRCFKATLIAVVMVLTALLVFFRWESIEDQHFRQNDAASTLHPARPPFQTTALAVSPEVPQDLSAGNSTLGVS
jgi:hypothetical protein